MFALAVALSLSVAPLTLPSPPPEISAPLGRLGDVVEPVPPGGVDAVDKPILPVVEGCDANQVVYLLRMASGTARAVEQFQLWFDGMPGFEAKFFARKNVLGDVVRQLADSRLEPKRACKALPLQKGYQLELKTAPKFCPAAPGATTGDFWFFTKGKPAAVVSVVGGDLEACKLRLSATLFDTKGQARVRLHANWGGAASAQIIGDGCKVIDFTFVSATQTFVPTLNSCKR
ncbi:MAG: hypothetical protein JNG84_06800 [Archangium sp.]|nr:hypothetical protein [Archangium sp.]